MSSGRALLASLAIAACLAPGWIPGQRGLDAQILLGWSCLLAPTLGVLSARHAPGVYALSVLGLFWIQCALVLLFSFRAVAEPACAAGVIAGLGLAGYAAGRVWKVSAGMCLFGMLFLCLLPSLPGWLGEPLSPQGSARLLDISPWCWVMEAAGVDWLRHSAVYEPAGALDIDPSIRASFASLPTALTILGLGSVSVALAEVLVRRRGPALVR